MVVDGIPDRRVCEIYICDPATGPLPYPSGSGLLLTGRLVLTANHVLPTDDVLARFPEVDGNTCHPCVVRWRSADLDAAVLSIPDGDWVPPALPALRWGRFVTGLAGIPAEAAGFPDAHYAESRDWAHAAGRLDTGEASRITLQVGSWPRPPHRKGEQPLWKGLAGAGLFSEGLLVGLVVEDPPEEHSRRLTAIRIEALLADPGFLAAVGGDGGRPSLEPAELAGLQRHPSPLRGGPARLLRAEAEVVPFHGRRGVLGRLRRWLDDPEAAGVRVLTGPGGQGKTRLARKFAQAAGRAGWLVVDLREDAPPALFERLRDVREPLLLVVDEAEKQRTRLERLVAELPDRSPVRLLLVARTGEGWLHELALESDPFAALLPQTWSGDDLDAVTEELGPLDDEPGRRADSFRRAVAAFSERLELSAAVEPPPLDDDRYGNVLAVHLEALARLLNAADPVDGPDADQILLEHETRYWARQAGSTYGLEDLTAPALRQTVAVATLCTVRRRPGERLLDLLDRVPLLDDEPQAVKLAAAGWLSDLYGEPGWQCATLHPAPLHEYLVGTELVANPRMLDRVVPILTERQAGELLTVLARAGAPVAAGRRRDPRVVATVTGLIDTLVRRYPKRLAYPAWVAAALVDEAAAAPLHAALDAVYDGEAAPGGRWRQSLSGVFVTVGDTLGRLRRRTRGQPQRALRPVVRVVQRYPGWAGGIVATVAIAALASPLSTMLPESDAGEPVQGGVMAAPPEPPPPGTATKVPSPTRTGPKSKSPAPKKPVAEGPNRSANRVRPPAPAPIRKAAGLSKPVRKAAGSSKPARKAAAPGEPAMVAAAPPKPARRVVVVTPAPTRSPRATVPAKPVDPVMPTGIPTLTGLPFIPGRMAPPDVIEEPDAAVPTDWATPDFGDPAPREEPDDLPPVTEHPSRQPGSVAGSMQPSVVSTG